MRTSACCVKPWGCNPDISTKYTGRSVEESSGSSSVRLYDAEDVRGIRRAAATAAFILREVCRGVVPGVSTAELDHRAEMLMAREEVTAAFNRFEGFPGHICVSVNDEAAHGIGRDGRIVNEGDLVSIDVGVFYEGYVGDCAGTVCPGTRHSRQAARLLSVARESLAAGIAKSRKGNYIAKVCDAIGVVVRREGLSIVQGNVGHGCGRDLHEPPALMENTPCGRKFRLIPVCCWRWSLW